MRTTLGPILFAKLSVVGEHGSQGVGSRLLSRLTEAMDHARATYA
jgi:predicted N-acetyltransferase YhbS